MTAALEGSEWSAVRPGRTLPSEKTRYPFYSRLGGPQGRSGRAKKSSSQLYQHTIAYLYCFTVHFCSLSFSPTYALIYIIKILSQAITLVALFTPTCFDSYGSSSGSTAGPC